MRNTEILKLLWSSILCEGFFIQPQTPPLVPGKLMRINNLGRHSTSCYC